MLGHAVLHNARRAFALAASYCCWDRLFCRILFSLLFALIAAGILSIFWHSKVVNIAISGIGAAVFACYIVFDVQLMMGGGTYSIEPDEYVFAAINIYLVSVCAWGWDVRSPVRQYSTAQGSSVSHRANSAHSEHHSMPQHKAASLAIPCCAC